MYKVIHNLLLSVIVERFSFYLPFQKKILKHEVFLYMISKEILPVYTDGVNQMLNNFLPNEHVPSVFDIDPEELKEKGVKGVITDLDNTLVAWDVRDATDEIKKWFQKMESHGIQVTIASNNKETRVKLFSEPLDTRFIYSARKPLSKAFKKAQKQMGLAKDEVVVVGDQLLTDVLGGNLAGFHTILVVPIVETDGFFTRINRKVERRILNWMRKKGKITWERRHHS
ncbi:YqeG family HAD IIIA-type phosphatase [Halobacillus mangrovi]|uniref:YqeG family HAD IIIA-type phosphatase n=1 Tax=Halobacillus mangrovi TaxID=402384 RepID=UPI0022B6F991|nr:YqeG family HAD IIIA-type phosphatase [Halobacillus mangrovi]